MCVFGFYLYTDNKKYFFFFLWGINFYSGLKAGCVEYAFPDNWSGKIAILESKLASTYLPEKQKIRSKKNGAKIFEKIFAPLGSTKVRISNKFIDDLKRIAELDTKMTEYDELGRLMKLRKEREKLIPKVIDKKKKIRAKRKSRQLALKKWIINISDD